MKQFNLEIATTSKCSMACTYCFEGEELQTNKFQQEENIDKIIEKIEVLLNNEKFNYEYPDGICINFWGGEPTLNSKWNIDFISRLKQLPIYSKLSFFIYSNGFDYTKLSQHIDQFTQTEQHQNKIRIQISWDGIDNGRVDHGGKPTNNRVMDNILKIIRNYRNLNISTKATIQPQELLRLEEIWGNYFKLFLKVEDINEGGFQSLIPRAKITFSPTLNYVDDFDDTNPEYLEAISKQFGIVLKIEQKFFERYNHHLFTWFSQEEKEARPKRLTNCTAGINILALDYNGSFTTCHGALYSDFNKEFEQFHDISLNQTKEVFTKRFFESRDQLKLNSDYVANSCISCSATTCYKCPIVNVEQIKEFSTRNYQVRDTRHCSIYKLFGKFDRLLLSLKQNKKDI